MASTGLRYTTLVVLGAVVAGLGVVTYLYQRDIQQACDRIARGSQTAQQFTDLFSYRAIEPDNRRHPFASPGDQGSALRSTPAPSGVQLAAGHRIPPAATTQGGT